MDSVGSNIRVQTRGNDVLRVLPVKNDSINQDWITDKTRFCLDAFQTSRVLHKKEDSDLVLSLVDNLSFSGEGRLQVQIVLGPDSDLETLSAADSFCSRFNANPVLLADTKGGLNVDWGGSYLLQSGLSGLEESDCLLLVGVNPKKEVPLLNARLRSSFLRDQVVLAQMGSTSDSGFPISTTGLGIEDFQSFVEGRHSFCKEWANAQNPKLVLSASLFEGSSSDTLGSLLDLFTQLTGSDSSINILNLHASSVGSSDLGRCLQGSGLSSKGHG